MNTKPIDFSSPKVTKIIHQTIEEAYWVLEGEMEKFEIENKENLEMLAACLQEFLIMEAKQRLINVYIRDIKDMTDDFHVSMEAKIDDFNEEGPFETLETTEKRRKNL